MSNWSDYYAQGLTADLYIRHLGGQREFLLAILDSGARRVLEIGAGTGAMSIFLSHCGLTVTTLDNDPKILSATKEAREKFSGTNDIVEGDAFSLPFEDNSFDLVFHQGLLEHFSDSDIHKLLDEHLRVAPKVMFSVPNNRYPTRDFGNERLMSKSEWEKIIEPYRIELSQDYSPKLLPRWYLPGRFKIQYMAQVSRP